MLSPLAALGAVAQPSLRVICSAYRIHGTNEPDSIGKNVSIGCIRLLNQDVIDLFNRVPVGSKVVVLSEREARAAVPVEANAQPQAEVQR